MHTCAQHSTLTLSSKQACLLSWLAGLTPSDKRIKDPLADTASLVNSDAQEAQTENDSTGSRGQLFRSPWQMCSTRSTIAKWHSANSASAQQQQRSHQERWLSQSQQRAQLKATSNEQRATSTARKEVRTSCAICDLCRLDFVSASAAAENRAARSTSACPPPMIADQVTGGSRDEPAGSTRAVSKIAALTRRRKAAQRSFQLLLVDRRA